MMYKTYNNLSPCDSPILLQSLKCPTGCSASNHFPAKVRFQRTTLTATNAFPVKGTLPITLGGRVRKTDDSNKDFGQGRIPFKAFFLPSSAHPSLPPSERNVCAWPVAGRQARKYAEEKNSKVQNNR